MTLRLALVALAAAAVLPIPLAAADSAKDTDAGIYELRMRRGYGVGFGSSMTGRPMIVTQQWRGGRTGFQTLLGGSYERFGFTEGGTRSTGDLLVMDLGVNFRFGLAGWQRSGLNLVFGLDATVKSLKVPGLERIRSSDFYVVLGLQYERYLTEHISVYAQGGLAVGARGHVSQIVERGVSPEAEDIDSFELQFGPASVASVFGITWWLH